METKLLNIGFGNVVYSHRIVAIVSPESAPIKRMVQDAKDKGRLIDATYGRRTRSVGGRNLEREVVDSAHRNLLLMPRLKPGPSVSESERRPSPLQL